VAEPARNVRPAVRSAVLLGVLAGLVYVAFVLLVHWRGG
jgi:hypothetical protein